MHPSIREGLPYRPVVRTFDPEHPCRWLSSAYRMARRDGQARTVFTGATPSSRCAGPKRMTPTPATRCATRCTCCGPCSARLFEPADHETVDVYAQGLRQIYRVDAGGRLAPEPVVTLPWRDPYCMPVGRTQPTAFVCSAADYTSDVWTLNDLGGERGGTER